MTDIRQHLPDILTALRQHIASAPAPEGLRVLLRSILPASYGIGSGSLVNAQGERSGLVDILLYDTTIPATLPSDDSSCHEVRRTLAVIILAHNATLAEIRELLQRIDSVKNLVSEMEIWQGLVRNRNLSSELLTKLAEQGTIQIRAHVAAHKKTPIAVLHLLAKEDRREIWQGLATNPHTPLAILEEMVKMPSRELWPRLLNHPVLSYSI